MPILNKVIVHILVPSYEDLVVRNNHKEKLLWSSEVNTSVVAIEGETYDATLPVTMCGLFSTEYNAQQPIESDTAFMLEGLMAIHSSTLHTETYGPARNDVVCDACTFANLHKLDTSA